MTENDPSEAESTNEDHPTFQEHDLLVDSDDDRHVPKILHDVRWNFLFERDEWIKPVDPPEGKREWPYWKIDTKLLNADAYLRTYRLRSTHPQTRTVTYDLVSQADLIEEYERVDNQEVREAARELTGTNEEPE